MAGSYPARPRSRTPFIITSYVAGPDGGLAAEVPTCCPCSTATEQCKVSVHDRRFRKTGPSHPLVVAACATHEGAFTLYPAGYGPYQRRPVQRLSPDGRAVASAPEAGEPAGDWQGTLFEAAVDAKDGRAWSRCSEAESADGRWWTTQGRHLRRCTGIVGVAAGLADSVREAIAATLSVGTLVLRQLSAAKGYRAVGAAVSSVLQSLRGGAGRAFRLLVCGHLVGLWGAPWRWDPARQVMERSPFSSDGTIPSS